MEAFRWHELAALAARLPEEKNISEAELEIHRVTRRSLQVNASIVHGHAGAGPGQLFVFHDVTRLKELENIRQEFVGNVSHELRTPLSLIKGFAQTLLDGAKDDPAQAARFLQKIDKHSDRLLFLIEDLLAISRLESGHAALNPQAVDLHDLARRVLDDLGARAAARKTVLENKIPPQTFVWADADRVQQVLFNLIENAIKYGRNGGLASPSGPAATLPTNWRYLWPMTARAFRPRPWAVFLSGSTAWTAPARAKAAAPAWAWRLSNILSRRTAARPGPKANCKREPPFFSPSRRLK